MMDFMTDSLPEIAAGVSNSNFGDGTIGVGIGIAIVVVIVVVIFVDNDYDKDGRSTRIETRIGTTMGG
jgi:hypothetical protein